MQWRVRLYRLELIVTYLDFDELEHRSYSAAHGLYYITDNILRMTDGIADTRTMSSVGMCTTSTNTRPKPRRWPIFSRRDRDET